MIELKKSTIELIQKEMAGIPEKYHKPFNSAHEGYAILLEEVEELKDEVFFGEKGVPHEFYLRKLRKEAVQVATMAIRFIQEIATESYPEDQRWEDFKHEVNKKTIEESPIAYENSFKSAEKELVNLMDAIRSIFPVVKQRQVNISEIYYLESLVNDTTRRIRDIESRRFDSEPISKHGLAFEEAIKSAAEESVDNYTDNSEDAKALHSLIETLQKLGKKYFIKF